ncbi:MAG: hypothetical protein IT379_40990 [Deltaproteobacteria bacterium]|nr:hypothetical protein [Deltaproteobacteria bacterium]
MTYRLVKGQLRLTYVNPAGQTRGGEPDGDSLWFEPAGGAAAFAGLPGPDGRPRSVELNPGGCVQLRFEAIDALELHYLGRHHQKAPACEEARDTLLDAIGFGPRQYATPASGGIPVRVKRADPPHPRPGYVLCRSIDPNRRPVVFVYAGTTTRAEGTQVHLTPAEAKKSLNAKQVANSAAYPTFYTTLPPDIRQAFAALAQSARTAGKGVWAVDTSREWTPAGSFAQLDAAALWPKLYRRLASYYADGATGLGGFMAWLTDPAAKRNDEVSVISTGAMDTELDDVVEVSGQKVRLKYDVEDLVVRPR